MGEHDPNVPRSAVLVQRVTSEGETQTLYAVAWERVRRGQVTRTGLEYLHARDQANARFLFLRGVGASPRRVGVRIVSVAPVVGFHVTDNHGERLIAS